MNASLVSEQGLNFHQGIREICRYVDSPISVGVVSIEEEAIVKEGIELSKIHSNVLVKCPLTPSGLKATKRLTAEDIRVNVSLCFSLTQALIAAKSGAWCVCPFVPITPATISTRKTISLANLSKFSETMGSPLKCFSPISVLLMRCLMQRWLEGIFVQCKLPCFVNFSIPLFNHFFSTTSPKRFPLFRTLRTSCQ